MNLSTILALMIPFIIFAYTNKKEFHKFMMDLNQLISTKFFKITLGSVLAFTFILTIILASFTFHIMIGKGFSVLTSIAAIILVGISTLPAIFTMTHHIFSKK